MNLEKPCVDECSIKKNNNIFLQSTKYIKQNDT